MDDIQEDERVTRKMERLTPTNIVTDGDEVVATYKYRVRGDILLDEFNGNVSIDGVKTQNTDDGFRWQYGDYTPVYLREDGVYAVEDTQEARVQAYFCLSYLEQEGLADLRGRR